MRYLFILVVLVFSLTNLVANYSVEEEVLEASNSMRNLLRDKKGIPISILKEAQAIVVIPGSLKFGFILGGKFGKGVASMRKEGW